MADQLPQLIVSDEQQKIVDDRNLLSVPDDEFQKALSEQPIAVDPIIRDVPAEDKFMGPPTLPQSEVGKSDLKVFLESIKDSPVSTLTKPQKDTASNVLKQYTLTTAQLNAAPGETLPENFELPAYSEIYAPIFDQQFPAIKNTDGLLANGLIDEKGATDKGLLVLDLKKIGALNDDYTLNLTGKALLSNQEESLKPENLGIFMERKRLGLDEPKDRTWSDSWKDLKEVLGSARDTLGAMIPQNIGDYISGAGFQPTRPTPKQQEPYSAKQKAILEGAVSGIVQQEAGLAAGAKKLGQDILIKTLTDGNMQELMLASVDQKYERDKQQMLAFKASESLHEITGLTNWVDQMKNVKTELGEEKFKAAQKTGLQGGPMLYSAVNPLAAENMAFRAAMSAAMVPTRLVSSQMLRARQTAEVFAEQTQSLNAVNASIAKAQATIKFAEKIPELEKAQQAFQVAGDMASARSVGKNIEKVKAAGQKAVFETEQWGAASRTISENLARLSTDAAAANRILKVADTFAQWPKVITTPVGYSLQKIGQGMTSIDSGLAAASEKIGAGKFYRGMNKLSSLAGVGTIAQTAGLPGELAWFPAAFKAAWSTAPAIEASGDFIRLVGREASSARGAIPMWRKIYRMQDAGPAHRLVAGFMDTATLGGLPVVQNAVKGAAIGTLTGVPLDMAYNYVSSGGDMNAGALKDSILSNAVFAGGGAALGAVRMGSKDRMKQFQMNDVLNFRRSIIEPDQRMAFDALPRGVRDSIGSYSGANPNLGIKFVKEGGGHFKQSNNTVYINPAAKNPLKPLLAHELLESIVSRTSMSTSIATILVGDGVQTGGLLRDKNGNLDQDFVAFRDRYNQLRQAEVNRMNQTVAPNQRESFTPLSDREMAKEYFIEMNADDMAAMAESGKLGQVAARTIATRKMIDLGNTILNKSSIIRNMHFNLGGMMDTSGRMVSGNGLLADGIKQLPEAKALFERMINETAGRPGAVKKVAEKAQGTVIPTSGMDDPIWSDMTSYWKTDKAGNPIKDSSGNWVPLEKSIEDAREQAGLLIQADQKQRIANGEVIPKHEIQYSPEAGWRGKYFSEAQIGIIKNSGYFNDSQIRLFDHINNAAKRGQGERFLMIYNPATSSRLRNRGRKSYATLGPTMKEGGILGFSMGQKGQLMIDIIDTQQLHQNIMEQAGKKIGQQLYKGDVDKIMTDINAVMDLHSKGLPADSHFVENYGTDWKNHKNFINSTFGDISGGAKARPGEWAMINPVLVTDRPSNAVFKTYRLDRLNKATRMEGTTGIPMDYNMVKANYMPEGTPLFDDAGDPVDMRYTPVEDQNGNLRAVTSENYGKQNNQQVEEAGGLPPEQGVPADRGTAVEAQKGVALEGSSGKEGQVTNENAKENTAASVYERSIRDEPDVGRKFLEGIGRTASEHPMGEAVTVKDASFYDDPDTRLFLAPDDLAGVAVTSYGDLVSVFKHPTSTEKIFPILEEAAKFATTLDAYDVNGFLPNLYSKIGFRPASRIAFDGNFVSPKWPYDLAGKPDIVLMVKDTDGKSGLPEIGTKGYDAVRDQVPLYATYDEAMAAQQKAVESISKQNMPEMDVSPDDVNFVSSRNEAEKLFADGKRMFAFNEMDETSTPITSREMLNAYPPDAIGWMEQKPASSSQYMPEMESGETGKPMDLMAYTSLGGNSDMIMSAKWGRTESGINPDTGKKQAAQTSKVVANSPNQEDHQVGFKRIDSLLKAPDLSPAQKKSLEDFVIKTAGFAVDSPGFRDLPTPKTLEEAKNVIAKVKNRMAKNLLSIYDAVPTPVKNYWQRWYPLAYDWNKAQSAVHKIPAPAIAGINARLSPGKDWIHNVNMTERILNGFTNNITMTKKIAAGAGPLLDAALELKLNSKENKKRPDEWKNEQREKNKLAKKEIKSMIGMKIQDMNSQQAARLVRFHTQVVGDNRVFNYFENGNPIYADAISWQSFVNIEKAINIYRDPTIESISLNMGDDHKIRSFYNNQIAPHDPILRDVTSDTHAVAATYLLPLSQKSLQVSRNFGTTSNSVAGMSGMYYIVADAYRMAADARGVEPRAMQSITWEGVRSMFPRGFKKPENVKKVEAIWSNVESKKITRQQALQQINGLMVDFFSKNPDSRPRVTVLPIR